MSCTMLTKLTREDCDDVVSPLPDPLPLLFRKGQFREKWPTLWHLKHFTRASSFFKSCDPPNPRESFSLLICVLVCFQERRTSIASCSSMGSLASSGWVSSSLKAANTSWISSTGSSSSRHLHAMVHHIDCMGTPGCCPQIVWVCRPQSCSDVHFLVALSSRSHHHRLLVRGQSAETKKEIAFRNWWELHTLCLCRRESRSSLPSKGSRGLILLHLQVEDAVEDFSQPVMDRFFRKTFVQNLVDDVLTTCLFQTGPTPLSRRPSGARTI